LNFSSKTFPNLILYYSKFANGKPSLQFFGQLDQAFFILLPKTAFGIYITLQKKTLKAKITDL